MVSLQKLPLSRYKHSETDDTRSKYGAIYGVFYGSILTPRISGGFQRMRRQCVPGSLFRVRKGAWGRGYHKLCQSDAIAMHFVGAYFSSVDIYTVSHLPVGMSDWAIC